MQDCCISAGESKPLRDVWKERKKIKKNIKENKAYKQVDPQKSHMILVFLGSFLMGKFLIELSHDSADPFLVTVSIGNSLYMEWWSDEVME